MLSANPAKVTQRAKKRGLPQLVRVGSIFFLFSKC